MKDELPEDEKPVLAKVFDYENVVGQDSLTRLDNKGGRNKKNNRKKPNRPKGPGNNQAEAGVATQSARPEVRPNPPRPNPNAEQQTVERPAGANRNNNRRKNNRPNNNRERPTE